MSSREPETTATNLLLLSLLLILDGCCKTKDLGVNGPELHPQLCCFCASLAVGVCHAPMSEGYFLSRPGCKRSTEQAGMGHTPCHAPTTWLVWLELQV